MREIMEIRGFSQNTIEIYINRVKNLAVYFNKPPHTLSPEHIHKYQVFLVQKKKVCWSTFNQEGCIIEQEACFRTYMWLFLPVAWVQIKQNGTHHILLFFCLSESYLLPPGTSFFFTYEKKSGQGLWLSLGKGHVSFLKINIGSG